MKVPFLGLFASALLAAFCAGPVVAQEVETQEGAQEEEVQEGGGYGFQPVTVPTANGGELTVSPLEVDGTTITCHIYARDGNAETGILRWSVPFQMEVEIPPYSQMQVEGMDEDEIAAFEEQWIRDRIAPLSRPEIRDCLIPALHFKYKTEFLREQEQGE